MPKFLIGTSDGKIRSVHDAPLKFSVSGRFVVDVPQELVVEAPTDSLDALVDAKVVAFKTQIPGRFFPFALYDEMLDPSTLDLAYCRRYASGSNKRTTILTGGYLTTDPLAIDVTTSQVYGHWYGFTLFCDPGPQPPDDVPETPSPPRLLYNYDPDLPGYAEFNPNDISARVLDNASRTSVVAVPDGTHIEVASVAGLPAAPFDIVVDKLSASDSASTVLTVTEVGVFGANVLTVSDTAAVAATDVVWWSVLRLTGNAVQSLSYGPGSVRLRFSNVSPGRRHLSDWILMHDEV